MSERDDSVSVYIMCHHWSGGLSRPVKVGISANPWGRLKSLQTGAPFRMAIAATFWTPSRDIARALETAFHTVKATHRTNGEWFDMSVTEALAAMCANYRGMLTRWLEVPPDEMADYLEMSGVLAAEQRLRADAGVVLQ